MVLDFAVVAPWRQEIVAEAATKALAAAKVYTEHGRNFLDIDGLCAASGCTFVPMVVETAGVWFSEASRVLRQLVVSQATREGTNPDTVLQHFL